MPSSRLLPLPALLVLASLAGCAAPSGDDEAASGTQDITSTQSFSDVCASSTNLGRSAGPPKGDAGSVIYLARCASSGPGRILRVDFKANTSVEIATFDASALVSRASAAPRAA